MSYRIIRYFYPDIEAQDLKKFSILSLSFIFTIGTYWLMRLLKDVVLYKLAFPISLGWSADTGRLLIPFIKTISPAFVLCLVLLYSKLVDLVQKHHLIYIIASFYMIIFSYMTVILFCKEWYGDLFVGKNLLAVSGVLGYLFTESFGSLMVALFWSFTISSCNSDQAKVGFPLIAAAGQFGAIVGSSLMLINTQIIWPFYGIVVVCLACLILSIYYFVQNVEQNNSSKTEEAQIKHGIWDGFRLLITQPYLIGVLIVSTFYEIATTIIEYQMNSQASFIFNAVEFKYFKGLYGVGINLLAFFIALLATRYIIKAFGPRATLLIYPIGFACLLFGLYSIYIYKSPTTTELVWLTFATLLWTKALAYAVNNPVKEMMYIPTSKDVRFKTKSIIDMFGSRLAKMSGARISDLFNIPNNPALSVHYLMTYGTLISLGIIGAWFAAALFVGIYNNYLIKNNKIIE